MQAYSARDFGLTCRLACPGQHLAHTAHRSWPGGVSLRWWHGPWAVGRGPWAVGRAIL